MREAIPSSSSLAADERRFELLIEAVVDYAVYILDAEGIVVTWNPGAERIKGYKADEIIGQSYERFFTPEDRRIGKPRLALETAARVGRYESEGWRQRRDGTRFWALAVVDAMRDPAGRVIGFAKVTRDMTEQRASQESLWESERRFRLLVNAVVDYGLFMLDTDGRVTAWNSGAERAKGYTAQEILGQHFSRFYTPEDQRQGLPMRALEISAREGKFETEGWRVRKDGTQFWARVLIEPVRDEVGGLVGFAKITRDMTDQREAERKLEQTREALNQAQKMEALGQLTGGIAHDFNNILAAIANNLELARGNSLADAKMRRQVDAALQAVHNGAGLIQQMMVLARKQPLLLHAMDTNTTIQGMLGLLRRACAEQIDIVADLQAGVGQIVADSTQLQTSLLNLVLNARDAMPKGGKVTISTTRAQYEGPPGANQPGEYVCISVADTGVGMSPEVAAHAFEPFFTTKDLGRGTGLGLSMVYGAMRQIGGIATLESEAGRGTTARLYIPAGGSVNSSASERSAADPVAPDGCGLPLLLAEDDPIVSMATVEMLEGAGYRVHTASRGDQAVRMLDEHPEINLLVTDVGLPGLNGHEVAAHARRRRPDLHVLFITGYDRTGAVGTAASQPGTAYLSKPYQPGDLFEALRQIAPRRRTPGHWDRAAR